MVSLESIALSVQNLGQMVSVLREFLLLSVFVFCKSNMEMSKMWWGAPIKYVSESLFYFRSFHFVNELTH